MKIIPSCWIVPYLKTITSVGHNAAVLSYFVDWHWPPGILFIIILYENQKCFWINILLWINKLLLIITLWLITTLLLINTLMLIAGYLNPVVLTSIVLQVSKAIKGEKEEDETEPDSSAENGQRKVKHPRWKLARTFVNYIFQCCGSRSGIRNSFFLDPGSRIPDPGWSLTPYFLELSDKFLWKLAQNFVFQHLKNNIIFIFVKFLAPKKVWQQIFFLAPLFCCCFWIRDPEWVKIRIRDPG